MKNFTIIIAFIVSIQVQAQFVSDTYLNTPLCTTLGKQNDARILGDGNGGAYIAWKDARNGTANPDIYMQHINAVGVAQWEWNGRVICDDLMDQSTPNLCTDGKGGVIVSWSDMRSGVARDVFAQRLRSDGTQVWAYNGVPVANKPIREHNEKITTDNNGGAYVVWEQYDETSGLWDVWAQHLDSLGNRLWDQNGLPVSGVYSNKRNPKIQQCKTDGFYVVWQDLENLLDYEIIAQRMSSAGEQMWGIFGAAVAVQQGAQINPKIDGDSLTGGIYVSWADKRNGNDFDIYAQRIDSLGNSLWMNGGVVVSDAFGNQSAVDIMSSSSSDGLILAWRDDRNGSSDIYAQRLSIAGNEFWDAGGLLISDNPTEDELNPNICSDGQGGAIIAWQDSTINDWDVLAQRITKEGVVAWNAGGAVVSSAIEIQSHPKQIPDGMGGAIFVWQDKRANQYDIYCHHFTKDGVAMKVEEVANANTLRLYPNPVNKELQLSFEEKIEQVLIYNEVGTLVRMENIVVGQMNLHLSVEALPQGMYVIEVRGNKTVCRLKFIKA